jgi:ribosome-associated protein
VVKEKIEPLSAYKKARICARGAADYKAQDVVVLNVTGLCSFTDYFILCSGKSSRQVQGIADRLTDDLRKQGIRALAVEGQQEGKWVLMDYGDVVIHVFYEPVRQFYDLESLWSDAEKTFWESDSVASESGTL